MFAEFSQPNGLAFAADESSLLVVDSGRDTLSRLTIRDGGVVAHEVVVAEGFRFDGIRIDANGRIWAATRTGVSCFDANGVEMLRLTVPEPVANLTFGGRQRNVLYLTATTSLYSLRTSLRG